MLACELLSSWQMDLLPLDRLMQAIASYPVLMAPITCSGMGVISINMDIPQNVNFIYLLNSYD